MKNPAFWHKASWLGVIMAPLGWLYASMSHLYQRLRKPRTLEIPVVCVGNVVMGGAGKTPTVMALAKILQDSGHKPHVLTRGYGRKRRDLLLVNPELHTYLDVGDEALLLGQHVPTWVYADRFVAGQAAMNAGATILLMDDGLQNPHIHKDRIIVVLDGRQGFGNGQVFPAGPLREFPATAAAKASAFMVIGPPNPDLAAFLKTQTKPIFHGTIAPTTSHLYEGPVVAFVGIGFPQKFLTTLEDMGLSVHHFKTFPDHHAYKAREIEVLLEIGLPVLTTEKDWVRLSPDLRLKITPIPICLTIKERKTIKEWLQDLLE